MDCDNAEANLDVCLLHNCGRPTCLKIIYMAETYHVDAHVLDDCRTPPLQQAAGLLVALVVVA